MLREQLDELGLRLDVECRRALQDSVSEFVDLVDVLLALLHGLLLHSRNLGLLYSCGDLARLGDLARGRRRRVGRHLLLAAAGRRWWEILDTRHGAAGHGWAAAPSL